MERLNKEDTTKKVYDFIKGNLINFVVVLTSLAYLFYGMVFISRTELTVEQVIANTGIGIIVGFLIKQMLSENGFSKGYRSNIWQEKLEKYNYSCNLANKYIERIDNFYYAEEREKKKNYRRQNLMAIRQRYDFYFDEEGNYKEDNTYYDKLNKYQRKIVNKCIKVKIYNLNLFSEYGNQIENDTHREITDKEQRGVMFGKNALRTILTAITGAYFVAQWGSWNWGSLITSLVQVCIWVSCGISQLYTNYNYVTIDKVNKLTKKMELLVKFCKGCDEGKYKVNPYDPTDVIE